MSQSYYLSPLASGGSYKLLDSNSDVRPNPDLQFKIVIVGDSGCGKTSLFTSFIRGYFPTDYEPTIFENHRAFVQNEASDIITVDLWDTAGQEDYERLRRLSYQDANLVILAYSLASRESLLNIPEVWAPEIINFCPNTPILLVGLKSDVDNQNVDPTDALKVAQNIGAVAHMKCSAKQMYNVGPLFDACFNIVYNGKKQRHRLTGGSMSPSKRGGKRFSGHFRSHSKQSSLTISLSSITERRRKKKERKQEERENAQLTSYGAEENAYGDNNDISEKDDYGYPNPPLPHHDSFDDTPQYHNPYAEDSMAETTGNTTGNTIVNRKPYGQLEDPNRTAGSANADLTVTSDGTVRNQPAQSYQIAQPQFGYNNNYTGQKNKRRFKKEKESTCCVIV